MFAHFEFTGVDHYSKYSGNDLFFNGSEWNLAFDFAVTEMENEVWRARRK